MVQLSEEDIIKFLENNGPSTPAQLAKHTGTTMLIASAMLGNVASGKNVLISNLKIGGGSPLYYLKKDVDKLQQFSDKLNNKDKQAYENLKEEKVLRDNNQTPLMRVSLRSIKDFAIPINIVRKDSQNNEQKELFWKWYLLNDDEAKQKIKNILSENEPSENKPTDKESLVKEQATEKTYPEESSEKNKSEKTEDEKESEPELEDKENTEKSKEEIISTEKNKQEEEKTEDVKQETTKKEKPIETQSVFEKKDVANKPDNSKHDEELLKKSTIGKKFLEYAESKKIEILSITQLRKSKEYEAEINVNTTVGKTRYYSKIIDKKNLNEGDISLTILEGQYKKLPTILFTTGKLNKKAEAKKETVFKNINIINL